MNEEDYEKLLKDVTSSSGYKKYRNYIDEIFNSEYFQDFVKDTREKYLIPGDGFTANKNSMVFPPEAWVGRSDREMLVGLQKDIDRVSKKYRLHHLEATDIFEGYIFYNDRDFPIDPNNFNLCTVSDLVFEKEDPFSKKTQRDDDRRYPIAIRISPYASLRDILDYTKKVYKRTIAPLQNNYREQSVKIGKFKKKKTIIQERNEFIYQNRDLPRKEIMRLVTDKFGQKNVIDYGYIGKIISLETKKRKEL